MTSLPLDSHDNPIPALRLKSGGAHAISVGSSSARNAAAFDAGTKVISLYATVPVYLRMGDASVSASASDHYFPAGVYYDVALGSDLSGVMTHIAVLRESTDGTLYISEKE